MSAFSGIDFEELRKELENDPLWKELDSVRKINEKLEKELELNKSWVKHHQKSVENKFAENEKLKEKIRAICFTQLQETDYCFGCEEHSDHNGACACIREIGKLTE